MVINSVASLFNECYNCINDEIKRISQFLLAELASVVENKNDIIKLTIMNLNTLGHLIDSKRFIKKSLLAYTSLFSKFIIFI